jgi:hypothetical protein
MEGISAWRILGALRVLAVNGEPPFRREDAKDAKETPRKLVWSRLGSETNSES